jgi:Fe-S-cluster-containing dehydrogenase component
LEIIALRTAETETLVRIKESAMRKCISVDFGKCTGCRLCALACSLIKTGTCNPVRSRIRIADWKEKGLIVPVICQDCEEPVCMVCCPVEAISRNPETGSVDINREICTNCKICIKVCPFGGPIFDPVAKEVILCDHCGGDPACVDVCTRGALDYSRVDSDGVTKRYRGMGEMRKSIISLGGV